MTYVKSFTYQERKDALDKIKQLARDDLSSGNYPDPSTVTGSSTTRTADATASATDVSLSRFDASFSTGDWASSLLDSGDLCIDASAYGGIQSDRICLRVFDPLIDDAEPSCGISSSKWPNIHKVAFSLGGVSLDTCLPVTPEFSLSGWLGIDGETGCVYGGSSMLPGIATCEQIYCPPETVAVPSLLDFAETAFKTAKEAIFDSPDILRVLGEVVELAFHIAMVLAILLLLLVVSGG